MRRVLVALMLFLATSDAVPVRTLRAMGVVESAPAAACSCCGACSCPSCTTHHPEAPDAGPGLHAADCGGCASGDAGSVPVPVLTTFEVPSTTIPPPAPHVIGSARSATPFPLAPALLAIDPPPRHAAA